MSLLMFFVAPTQAVVVTDTLATTPEGDPFLYVSKCFVVPHLDMVIAGTGVGSLGARWSARVQENLLCRGIEMLDLHAPEALRMLWGELETEHGPIDRTSTIYHFGRAESSGEYVGFAYRSADNFESDPRPHGFGIKPPPDNGLEGTPEDIDGWIEMAKRVRVEQEAADPAERLYIGGALTMALLQDGAIVTQEIYRWDDFDDMWQTMNARLAAEQA
jgi:hypothetical protein